MASFGITFSATGEDDVTHHLLGIGDRATNPRPVFRQIVKDLQRMERQLFETEDAWPPLKESTIEKKSRGGFPLDILKETEALFESLTRDGAGGFDVMTETELHFGTSDPKAKFHRTGTRFMPKRDPLQVKTADRRRWQKMIQAHLMAEERAMFGTPAASFETTPFGL